MTMTKFEVMDKCNAVDIPVGPILSMKEIAEEQSLRDTGTVVEVDHPTRGKYLTVGNPIKLSDSPCEVAALAAARRAHRGDPRQGARLFGHGDDRDQGLGRDHAGREGRARGGGVSSRGAARPRESGDPGGHEGDWMPAFAGMSGTELGGSCNAYRGPRPAGVRQGGARSAVEARREHRRRLCRADQAGREGRPAARSRDGGEPAGLSARLLQGARRCGRNSARSSPTCR